MMRTGVPLCSLVVLVVSAYLLLIKPQHVQYTQVLDAALSSPERALPEKPPCETQEVHPGESQESAARRAAGLLFADEAETNITAYERIDRRNQQCKRRENLFYLKIHKTGSSTMTMLTYRFIFRHNLSVLLVNRNPFGASIEKVQMHPPPDVNPPSQFNLFAEHYYYKDDDVAKMMPEDTAHIATIRYPLSQMRAVMIEFGHVSRFDKNDPDPVQTYLKDIYRWGSRGLGSTKSLQMEEFGVAKDKLDDMDAVRERIQFIEKTYTQVLVAEYFDESLLLAKRKLCWETEDIIYLMLRSRNYRRLEKVPANGEEMLGHYLKDTFLFYRHKSNVLDWGLEQVHRNWSQADYLMYDYFTNLLFKEIRREENFWDELEKYRNIKTQLARFCEPVFTAVLADRSSVYRMAEEEHNYLAVNATPWGKPFKVHAIECLIMRMDTVVLRNCIKVLQYPELCTSPKITRVFDNDGVRPSFDIVWKPIESNTLHIQKAYCTEIHPKFKVPLAILTEPHAFMGLKVE